LEPTRGLDLLKKKDAEYREEIPGDNQSTPLKGKGGGNGGGRIRSEKKAMGKRRSITEKSKKINSTRRAYRKESTFQ